MEENKPNPLNRRKPENRWKRINRDANHDQESSVRHWLKLARKVFEKDREEEEIPASDRAA